MDRKDFIYCKESLLYRVLLLFFFAFFFFCLIVPAAAASSPLRFH